MSNIFNFACVIICISLLALHVYSKDSQDFNMDLHENNSHCDEEYCQEVVENCFSNCSCQTPKSVGCIAKCIKCLGASVAKCCSCVGLCLEQLKDEYDSHVGDINESDEQLFDVLTETDDIHGRWRVQSGAIERNIADGEKLAFRYNENKSISLSLDDSKKIKNCTVAFINKYLSMTRCKQMCLALGASHFRWFQDGCCECVGKYCFDYGINSPDCVFDTDDGEYN